MWGRRALNRPFRRFPAWAVELKRAVVAAGGAVSHHHGIGKLRKPFIEDGTLWCVPST